MGIKYKLKLKDLKLEYLIEYFSPLLKYLSPKKKINNYSDLKEFVKLMNEQLTQKELEVYQNGATAETEGEPLQLPEHTQDHMELPAKDSISST